MTEPHLDGNGLLKAVNPLLLERFRARGQVVDLRRGTLLHRQGDEAERVYFPLTGLVAVLSESIAGESVQTGMVGCDGAVGALEARGSRQHLTRGVVQVSGVAVRFSAGAYHELCGLSSGLRAAVERYAEMLLAEARQFMACNALHTVESRLSRSLLEALERSCLERELPITQEALAQMLGAQRTTVAACVSKLQRRELIKSRRGAIEIVNRAGLERVACNCRRSLRFAREQIERAWPLPSPVADWSKEVSAYASARNGGRWAESGER